MSKTTLFLKKAVKIPAKLFGLWRLELRPRPVFITPFYCYNFSSLGSRAKTLYFVVKQQNLPISHFNYAVFVGWWFVLWLCCLKNLKNKVKSSIFIAILFMYCIHHIIVSFVLFYIFI